MVDYLGKVYNYTKSDNDEGYTKALGLTSELSARYMQSKPSVSLLKNGDGSYTLKLAPYMEVPFKVGEEFDEEVIPGVKFKTTITLEGNVLKQVQKHPGGKVATILREFGPTELVSTSTVSGWNGKGLRYFSAA